MVLAFGLCACGDSADSSTTDSKSTKTTVAQDKSQTETTVSNDEEISSAVEEVDYQYGVVSIDELDAYAREAAETMAVGKDEWDKME